jgi:hypothetical protein
MDNGLLAAYDRPVPRYTSYPTAAQFTPAIGPVQHDAWLRDLNDSCASLYVHVPFCRELCWYCACHTMAMNRPGTLDHYADALLRELEALARVVEPRASSGPSACKGWESALRSCSIAGATPRCLLRSIRATATEKWPLLLRPSA